MIEIGLMYSIDNLVIGLKDDALEILFLEIYLVRILEYKHKMWVPV